MIRVLLISFPVFLAMSCLTPINDTYTSLPPGIWRAELDLAPPTEVVKGRRDAALTEGSLSEALLPFNFEVSYDSAQNIHITIINGAERIHVKHIKLGRDQTISRDTFYFDFPIYDSYIHGQYEEGRMKGEWVVTTKENYAIPFSAKYAKEYRFTEMAKTPLTDISGRWAVTFGEGEDAYPAVGEFQQDGNHVTGTFATESGDYRYLDGTIQGDKLYLSTFDGSHAFLFEALLTDSNSMSGIFYSGNHYTSSFIGQRNAQAQLTPDTQLTTIKGNSYIGDLSIHIPNGETFQLDDERWKGHPKIIQILGTWCPNCRDETKFITQFLAENPHASIKVVGIAFERTEDENQAEKIISRYKNLLQVPYPIGYGGRASKSVASDYFPMLSNIISFPTLIFVDRFNSIYSIHTGFYGPATQEYQNFKTTFEETVHKLTQ